MKCKYKYEGEDKINYKLYPNYSIYYLADGHGGDFVSSFINNNFIKLVNTNMNQTPSVSSIQNAINKAVEMCESTLSKYTEGSTLVGFVIFQDKAVIFNIGDSRCYSINNNGELKLLTIDHCMTNEEEMKRLQGYYFSKDGRLDGKLMMTRSIGDNDVKGKISTPTFKTINISDIKYIILMSDGVYTSFKNESDISKIINSNNSLTRSINLITEYATKHGDGDDKSILIKSLKK